MKSVSRKLFGSPVLLQDWDVEAEELTAKYWELFLDLLLVGSSSAIASNMIANQNARGVAELVVLFLVTINGWMLYSHHYTSRFEDGSLFHSLILFPFLLGTAICIVNASFTTASAFCFGCILQRFFFLIILSGVYTSIERGRSLCIHLGIFTVTALVIFLVGYLVPDYAVLCLYLSLLVETFAEFIMVNTLRGRSLVPINIEHSKDRLGCMILIMLGETVVTAVISNQAISTTPVANRGRYYWIMGLSFLLIFMFTLLFFHMQPAPQDHAFRRNRIRGCFYLIFHKLLGLALLAVGVAVRLMVQATIAGNNLTDFGVILTGVSVGSSLLVLLGIRYVHYGGVYPRDFDPPYAVRIFYTWWVTFALFAIAPFLLIFANIKDPLLSAALNSGMIFALCLIESTFTHILEPFLTNSPSAEAEAAALKKATASTDSYQATGELS